MAGWGVLGGGRGGGWGETSRGGRKRRTKRDGATDGRTNAGCKSSGVRKENSFLASWRAKRKEAGPKSGETDELQ